LNPATLRAQPTLVPVLGDAEGLAVAFRGCLIFLIVVELALAGLVQLLPD